MSIFTVKVYLRDRKEQYSQIASSWHECWQSAVNRYGTPLCISIIHRREK